MSQSLKKIIKDLDKPLLIIIIVGFIYGLLTIVTASSRAAVVNYDVSIYHYFYKQLLFIIFGIFLSLIIFMVDTKHYKTIVPFLFIFAVILNIVAWKSESLYGSSNWIDLKFFKLQPSEFSKPILITAIALMFEMYYRELRTKNKNHFGIISLMLIISFIIPALIFFQKDLGTLLITLFIIGMMFLISPILSSEKLKYGGLLLIVGIIGLFVFNSVSGGILNEARMSRFTSWFDPCGQYETGGYQVCNSYIAINDGGLMGLGIGKSKQKYSYIPEPHTDSAFAIIAEEYGIKITVFIFLGYLFILWRILQIASRATTLRGRYMCVGVACYIFAHIAVNLGGMFGLIPLTGVPLPFFSYGGSFVISFIAALAIVQRVNIETRNQKIKL